MFKDFPQHHKELRQVMGQLKNELPETLTGFGQLHQAATAEGELSTKFKELIALGIAIAVRCDGCIAFHVHDALKAGATRKEIIECIGVAILMGGSPALMYGCEAFEAINQFHEQET